VINKGIYSDFNTKWYYINGDIIVQTMMLNCFMPALVIFAEYMMYLLKICWDKRGGPTTHCKSINAYLKLYGGIAFSVHFRYSNMLNIFFMTMMYGTALPLLYPIALISYAVLYV
jgi:hypothetical protein